MHFAATCNIAIRSPAAERRLYRPMPGRFGSSVVLLALAAYLLGSLPSAVDAHAALLTPASRNEAFWPGQWISNAGNGLGGGRPVGFPGVCGDPYQGISSDLTNFAGPVTTYTAGQRVSFRVRMQVNHGGRLTFRICDRSTGLDQNCFNNGRTLLRADNGRPHTYILTGSWARTNAGTPEFINVDYNLPAGFTCTRCVLQMEYFTYNSCVEPCPREECGFYADRMNLILNPGEQGPKSFCPASGTAEIFRNCADIAITGTPGTCRNSPANPANGVYNCGATSSAGRVCTATCNSGFTGAPSATCQSNGAWSATTGSCQQGPAVTCRNSPANPANGVYNCGATSSPGRVCTATCNSGFTGAPSATCQSNGAWSATTGACQQSTTVTCRNSPTNPANGVFNCGATSSVGRVCTATCNSGFTGSPSATCQNNGAWSGVTGQCSSGCPAPTSPQARATCFCSGRAPGRYQDVQFNCAGGFWCFNGGSQYIQCANGLRYDASTGVCNWAASVPTCSASIVGPASTRLARRTGPVDASLVSVPAEQDGQVAATAAAEEPADPSAPIVPVEAAAVPSVVDTPVEVTAAATAPVELAPVDAANATAAAFVGAANATAVAPVDVAGAAAAAPVDAVTVPAAAPVDAAIAAAAAAPVDAAIAAAAAAPVDEASAAAATAASLVDTSAVPAELPVVAPAAVAPAAADAAVVTEAAALPGTAP